MYLKDTGVYRTPKFDSMPKFRKVDVKGIVRSAGRIAQNTSRAVGAGIQAGRGFAQYANSGSLKAGVSALQAAARINNMGAAYRTLASYVAVGTKVVLSDIPRGVKWLGANTIKVAQNVWRVVKQTVRSSVKYLLTLIKRVNEYVAKKIVYANPKNTHVKKNVFRPSTYTAEGRRKLGEAKAAKKVKRTARRLAVAEVGLAAYGIKTSIESAALERKARELSRDGD